MATALWIAAGGAVGTLARFAVTGLFDGHGHPWGTVTVNILGSFALGVLAGFWGMGHVTDQQLALTVGLLGGFTTFSTFALDTIRLWENGDAVLAAVTVATSVVVGLGAALAGLAIGRNIAL